MNKRMPGEHVKLPPGEAALRTDEEGGFRPARSGGVKRAAAKAGGVGRAFDRRGDRLRTRPGVQAGVERDERGDGGDVEPLALLGSLAGDRAEPLEIDAAGDGPLGRDRVQRAGAELDRHADDEIGRVALQRGEDQGGTFDAPRGTGDARGTGGAPGWINGAPGGQGRAEPVLDQEGRGLAAAVRGQACLPLARMRVEDADRVGGRQAQHVAQIVRAVAVEGDRGTFGEVVGQEQTRRVPHGHPPRPVRHSPGTVVGDGVAYTDIGQGGWIARLPPKARAFANLARIDRPIGVWLLFLPGLWGILLGAPPRAEAVRLLAVFALGSLAMRSAGCAVNDLWDRDIDRRVARTAGRPLASGALTVREALGFAAAALAVALVCLLALPPICWAMAAGSLVLVAVYPLAKRVTWWPQLVMGLPFGFGAPMGYVAATGRIDWACAALYAAAILWDLGFDTIYGFQDIEDDAVVGVRSTSRRFAGHARLFVGLAYGGAVAALAAAIGLAGGGWAGVALLVLPAALLARQVARLDTGSPPACLALFKSNRTVGLAVALAVLVGTSWR